MHIYIFWIGLILIYNILFIYENINQNNIIINIYQKLNNNSLYDFLNYNNLIYNKYKFHKMYRTNT